MALAQEFGLAPPSCSLGAALLPPVCRLWVEPYATNAPLVLFSRLVFTSRRRYRFGSALICTRGALVHADTTRLQYLTNL